MDDDFIRGWEYVACIGLLLASVGLCILGWRSNQLEVSRSTITAGVLAAFFGILAISMQRHASDSSWRKLWTYCAGLAITGLLDLGSAWIAAQI